MKVEINGKYVKLPDFLIVGAAKSGTTSLYHYLQQHPRVFMPKNKEPGFFSFVGVANKDTDIFKRGLNIVTNLNEYADLFAESNDLKILGEASTCYLYLYEETIKNIKKYHPAWKGLKIIIIIRNPIERVFSHYQNDVACGAINVSFEDVIENWKLNRLSKFCNYIGYGSYYNQIKAYKTNFDYVKVYLFDDLKLNATPLVKNIFNFLEIDSSFVPDTSIEYNVSVNSKNKLLASLIYKPNFLKGISKTFLPKVVREKIKNAIIENFTSKSRLENSSREFLVEIYKEDVLKIQDLINRDLTQWLQ